MENEKVNDEEIVDIELVKKNNMAKSVLPVHSSSSQYDSNNYLLSDTANEGDEPTSFSGSSSSNGAGGNYFSRTLRMTRKEVIHGMANRLLYSTFYKQLYVVMCVLSIISLIMSLVEKCPGVWFIVFESIVNLTMVIEVTIRVLALGNMYWKSVWNFLDILIVFLCVLTMFSLFFTQCSTERSNEAILDTGLLIIRNGIQLGRLISITRRNRRSNVTSNPTKVDFSTIKHDRWSKRYNSFASITAQDVPYTFKDTSSIQKPPSTPSFDATDDSELKIDFSASPPNTTATLPSTQASRKRLSPLHTSTNPST